MSLIWTCYRTSHHWSIEATSHSFPLALGLLVLSSGKPCCCWGYWSWFLLHFLLHFRKQQNWKYHCCASCLHYLGFSGAAEGEMNSTPKQNGLTMSWKFGSKIPFQEHGMFLRNVNKVALSQQACFQWDFINSEENTVLLSFYGKRGWKWERPLKAASVFYQTGATL